VLESLVGLFEAVYITKLELTMLIYASLFNHPFGGSVIKCPR